MIVPGEDTQMKSPLVKYLVYGTILFILGFFAFNYLIFWMDKPRDDSVTVKPDEKTNLMIGDFYLIEGTGYFMIPISNDRTSSFLEYSSARWYSVGTSGQLRNLIFLDSQTLVSRKLFDTNESFLLSVALFPERKANQSDSAEERVIPVEWITYYVIYEDSNGDGFLNEKDTGVIAISDYNGQRYKVILTDVMKLYELTMSDHGRLIIVYSISGGRYASMVDMNSQTIVITEPLPDLGSEVD